LGGVNRTALQYQYIKPISSFTSRDEELKDIKTCFNELSDSHYGIIIHGLSGVGKSELAKKYAAQNLNDFDSNIIFLDASDIEKSIEDFGIYAAIPTVNDDKTAKTYTQIVSQINKYFRHEKVLFILDNAVPKLEKKCKELQCNNDNISILITSQNSAWSDGFKQIHLESFSKDSACRFLENSLNLSESNNSIKSIAEKLNGHPLALQTCISFIKGTRMTSDEYLEMLQKQGTELLETSGALTSLKLSIRNIISNQNATTIFVLKSLPFLNGQFIERNFFDKLFAQLQ